LRRSFAIRSQRRVEAPRNAAVYLESRARPQLIPARYQNPFLSSPTAFQTQKSVSDQKKIRGLSG